MRDWKSRDYIWRAEGAESPWPWLASVYDRAGDEAASAGWCGTGEAEGDICVMVCGLELVAVASSFAAAGPSAHYPFQERTLNLRLVFSLMSLPTSKWGDGYASLAVVSENGLNGMDFVQAREKLFFDAFTDLLALPAFRPTADAWRERLELGDAASPATATGGPRRI